MQERGLALARPIAGVLATFYVVVSASHFLLLPADLRPPMLVATLLAAALLTAVWRRLERGRVRPEDHGRIVLIIAGCVGGIVLLRMALLQDPLATNILMLVIVALGVLLVPIGTQVVLLAGMLSGWLAIALQSPNPTEWYVLLPTLMVACVLSLAFTLVGERVVRHNIALRLGAQRRSERLSDALVAAEEARSALRASEAKLRTLVDTSDAMTFSVDTERRLLVWNEHFREACEAGSGQSPEPDRPLVEVLPFELDQELSSLFDEALAGRPQRRDVLFPAPAGDRIFDVSVAPIRTAEGQTLGAATFARDITQRKHTEEALRRSQVRYAEAAEKMRYDARHDQLTGLPNRAHFLDELDRAWHDAEKNDGSQFAVIYLDLDRFKVVNDSLGHSIGDQLLVAFGERMRRFVRPGDTVARFGGDEFAVLVGTIQSVDDAVAVAERLQAVVASPFQLSGFEVHTTASIGIAGYDGSHSGPTAMLRDADIAMYRAKSAGRGRHRVFDTDMHEQAVNRLELEMALRRAIDGDQLRVFYQPIVALGDRRLVAFEALLRWRHPTRGLLSPPDFMALAHETGLIVAIGEWVLSQACRQLRAWQLELEAASDLCVSVNLSDKEVARSGLVRLVERTLHQHRLSPHNLWLEVTEDVFTEHLVDAAERLRELRARGVRVGVDDFGTGYSGLSQLGRYPFDLLKSDRSLLAGDWSSGADERQLLEALVTLSRSLDMELIAEGIQSEEQVTRLQQLGVPYGQGFLFSEALPAGEATRYILRSSAAQRVSAEA